MAKPSGGRRFSKTCLVLDQEDLGRMAIIKRGPKHTRVAPIRGDGRTADGAVVITNDRILDIRDERETEAPRPRSGIVGDRGVIVLPVDLRQSHGLGPGAPFLIEERAEGILIRPASIVPRRPESTSTIDDLLEGITPEMLHPEIDTGPASGRESW